ncbi:hypothetical protein ACIOD2_38050 [Amycolatopsis sp. NPDC088138]|uniref:hypothetical protein n=1 Tax=Amycolatopsis sp. NPDC088138 TaxID=3363938 RepID=UPI003827794E
MIAADLLTYTMELGAHTRVGTVRVCCAVAEHVHARRDVVAGHHALLRELKRHWRFEVREALPDNADTVAFGTLSGAFQAGVQRAELHADGPPVVLSAGLEDGDLRLFGVAGCPAGAVLRPAECAD